MLAPRARASDTTSPGATDAKASASAPRRRWRRAARSGPPRSAEPGFAVEALLGLWRAGIGDGSGRILRSRHEPMTADHGHSDALPAPLEQLHRLRLPGNRRESPPLDEKALRRLHEQVGLG